MDRITTLPPLPPRPADGHKGMFGRVLVVGGNDEMIGAPVMAGTSALRMGAGLVQAAVPKSILLAVLSITPELIGLGLGSGTKTGKLLEAAGKADAIVLGPGLGQSPQAHARVKSLIRLDKPMVIDADALNILAAAKRWTPSFKATAVLTPHPGEMSRLGKLFGRTEVPRDEPGRIDIATQAAKTFGQTIVLKGQATVVTDGLRVYVNTTGDSSLSKAGTGDVLSGVIGTLLAQKLPPFDAACAAVWLHGRAGEIAGQRQGMRCVLAREVIDALPQAIQEYPA
ncbi:MAG TPA: NAD(P)H-hydrate dehydratase [Tepidisphaeraceae bacterium]|nr:NAD(P)H-hydrate dehydratase [Tepidisphaeraceae bacterium]